MMISNKERLAPFYIFLSAFLWSLSGVFTKSVEWNGLCLATLRGLIAFIAAVVWVRGKRIQLNFVKVLCGICYFMQGVLFISANKYTTAVNATVLQNMSPLYIILFNAIITRQIPNKKDITVCLILFLGIGLAFIGNSGGGATIGNIFAMVSAFFYAGVYYLSKQEGAELSESLLIGNACFLMLIPIMVTNKTVLATDYSSWLFLLFFAFFSGFGAWFCFASGIKNCSALQASFIALAEPVMAPLWTFIFLNEKMSILSFAGFMIVILTLVIYNISLVHNTEKMSVNHYSEIL